jgi:hypothetical protein
VALKILNLIWKAALLDLTLDAVIDQVTECNGIYAIESLAHCGIDEFCISTRAFKLMRGFISMEMASSDSEEEEYGSEEDEDSEYEDDSEIAMLEASIFN